MKLHWSPRSPYVRKVMVAAYELGLNEQIEKTRSVVAMSSVNLHLRPDNPLNKIPTLVLDDGLAIFDSYVICDYLDSLAGGGKLIPLQGRVRVETLRMHALGSGLLDLLILARNERERPDLQRSSAHMLAFADKREATLKQLEREVTWLLETPFNLGHIAVGCALSYADFRFANEPWREDVPHLAQWHRRFEARESAVATQFKDG